MAVKRKPKPLLIFLILLLMLIILLITVLITVTVLSSPIDKNSKAQIEVVIPSGTGISGVAKILKDKNIIRSENFFKIYVKLTNKNSLKATTYSLEKNMSLKEIVDILEKGNSYNPDTIKLTFKEGCNVSDYISLIAKNTNHTEEDILKQINDRTYIESLVKKYWFLTDELLNPDIYYPLEGYLFPNTYYFENKDVKITTIIETMLDETDSKLRPYKAKTNSNINEYIILASILELEGTNTKNRKMIAGVFNNRLSKNMNLGSDVTTYYALRQKMTSDLTVAQFNTDNPYNTRSEKMAGKLPIGAICNPSISSIEASINPTENEYLYFVADKNGNIYYTKTYQEHTQKVNEIKKKGDWIW